MLFFFLSRLLFLNMPVFNETSSMEVQMTEKSIFYPQNKDQPVQMGPVLQYSRIIVYGNRPPHVLPYCRFLTISGHFFDNYLYIFHKTVIVLNTELRHIGWTACFSTNCPRSAPIFYETLRSSLSPTLSGFTLQKDLAHVMCCSQCSIACMLQ